MAPEPETVILLHGMGRSRASLWILQAHLASAGFEVRNFPYGTRRRSLDAITDDLRGFVAREVQGSRYHFVGHSLGNIIVRHGFRGGHDPRLGRIVMIAPPNHPAKLAGLLRDLPLYKMLTGDSGQKLGDPAFYADLPVPPVEFGVIAGDRGPRLAFDEPNDGIVAVASTRLEGMHDWLQLPQLHTFIMNAQATRHACVSFLRTGRFEASPA